ncbi:hypothetical protein V2J09_003577 [Rumex salicifolius]
MSSCDTPSAEHASLLLKEYFLTETLIPFTSVACGIFICKMVYDLCECISSYCKGYSRLPRNQQIEWNNRAISTVHALFITTMSIYLAFWSDLYSDDQQGKLILQRSSLSNFVLGVSVGYFLTDVGMIFWFYPDLGGVEYVLHHLVSVGALVYAMFTGEGQFYTFLVLISETTTPSINLRWYLDAAGLRRSKAYLTNGVVLFFTWLIARILLFIYVFYHLFLHYDQIEQLTSFGFALICFVPVVLSVLNVMWFGKIIKGLVKTLQKSHTG